MKRAYLPLSFFIILVLVGAYAVVGILKDSGKAGNSSENSSSTSAPMNETPFQLLLKGYSSYYELDEGTSGEYLWKKLDPKSYSCNLSSNEDFLKEKARNVIQIYKNLSVNETSRGDLVGVLLLADLRDRISDLTASYVSPFANTICLMENRLKNFEMYKKEALEVHGYPSFSFDDLSNLSLTLKNITYKTYWGPLSGSWVVDVRVVLKHFIYRAIYNESLVEPFLSDYSYEESASLLVNLSDELKKDPYAESVFKPSLIYLAYWWSWEYQHSSNPPEVNDKYLKIFWAWYKLVNPEKFIGG
ncbi:hypothetical protein [Thermococcus waiotapuensis]|uniref:Uncharacterized protein n=1 Tax=Thermococcus waiotapuensis TaxID=90909 RepID=A0AAE4NWF0_9EURY|nr:hypothetical protein [Thermococcus waiotapuensis]MDV3104517.1 hypothetical protein [Thermococcus waiotapuensis]